MARSNISIRQTMPWILLLIMATSPTLKCAEGQSPLGQSKALFPPKDTVDILNQMSGAITTHCMSRDDDIGMYTIAPGATQRWRFHHNFWDRTLFWCRFWSPSGRTQAFEVWSEGVKKHSKCYRKCYWFVRDDGFWVTDYNYHWHPESATFMLPW
ncbi:hypothetical protein KC19_5G122300 [Ceratodon purpureus]|uniref:S-protein homolog n=1 Tax=Ceratodon purpureus TaxID=3225 RepID=A0A8T0I0K1_CERPU|nr:hypothetical protein KC19_5G122300 [Ceratodon purpureus]